MQVDLDLMMQNQYLHTMLPKGDIGHEQAQGITHVCMRHTYQVDKHTTHVRTVRSQPLLTIVECLALASISMTSSSQHDWCNMGVVH